jgi:hypothetical protein
LRLSVPGGEKFTEVSIRLNSEAELAQLRQQVDNWPLAKVLRVRSL